MLTRRTVLAGAGAAAASIACPIASLAAPTDLQQAFERFRHYHYIKEKVIACVGEFLSYEPHPSYYGSSFGQIIEKWMNAESVGVMVSDELKALYESEPMAGALRQQGGSVNGWFDSEIWKQVTERFPFGYLHFEEQFALYDSVIALAPQKV